MSSFVRGSIVRFGICLSLPCVEIGKSLYSKLCTLESRKWTFPFTPYCSRPQFHTSAFFSLSLVTLHNMQLAFRITLLMWHWWLNVCDCQPQESEITPLGSTPPVCTAISSTKLLEQKIASPPNGFVF